MLKHIFYPSPIKAVIQKKILDIKIIQNARKRKGNHKIKKKSTFKKHIFYSSPIKAVIQRKILDIKIIQNARKKKGNHKIKKKSIVKKKCGRP